MQDPPLPWGERDDARGHKMNSRQLENESRISVALHFRKPRTNWTFLVRRIMLPASMPRIYFTVLVLLAACIAKAVTAADSPAPSDYPVTITIDASKPVGELRPIWRYFGYDEPNYTYMK